MEKVFTPIPDDNKHEKAVKALVGREKWKYKNKLHEGVEFPISYNYKGYNIIIVSADENERDLLEVFLVVRKDGKRIKVPQPFVYQNPPIKASNGTWRKIMINEKEEEIENTEVNIKESLKQIVGHTVTLTAK